VARKLESPIFQFYKNSEGVQEGLLMVNTLDFFG